LDVALCHWVCGFWCLEGLWCLHFQGRAVREE
jgi:hypothetical protein